MWIRIILCIILVLSVYTIILLLFIKLKLKSAISNKKEVEFVKTNRESKAVKTVVIKAVKKNTNDDLGIITNRYIFENNISDLEKANIPDIEVEMTINDESLISELEENDMLKDIEKMADLLKCMSPSKTKEKEESEECEYNEYKDFDDNIISEFLNNGFLENNNNE